MLPNTAMRDQVPDTRTQSKPFLRCIFKLDKADKAGHNYEDLLDQYLEDKKRNRSADVKVFSECLIKESVSKQSARQRLTYAVKFLRAQGVSILDEDVQDIKREAKGGAATVDKALTAGVICQAIKGADVRNLGDHSGPCIIRAPCR